MSQRRAPGDHEEELLELQRRFNALSEQKRTAEGALLTKEIGVPDDGRSQRQQMAELATSAEIPKLDEQIVDLRRKHDRLHDSNHRKRQELNILADKLKDLHSTKYSDGETPQQRLRDAEMKLEETAARYDEEYRTKMTYEQVIKRLKNEQLGFPAEVKALEQTLAQKEADYEQLLLMSHDANQSKEHAKGELSKFEALVSEERKLREKELQERRVVLQKKQQLATELDKTERERRMTLQDQQSKVGEDSARQQMAQTEKLIVEEQKKIAAYEAAFQQIKEATGVADVNEVIQRFLSQEETHQNLLAMTRESQDKIDELRAALEAERQKVLEAQYSLAQIEGRDDEPPDRASNAAARQALERSRARWKKLFATMVNCKSAVQHILDVLEPLRADDEVIAPLTDETLLTHLQHVERKLQRIAAAFFDDEERHAELMLTSKDAMPKAALMRQQQAANAAASSMRDLEKSGREEDSAEDEFAEDVEEDVLDREALKKQARSIVDKGAKKKKLAKKKARPRVEEGDEKKPNGQTSTAFGTFA
ncbi:hypothetical protein AB1Y20_016519 [Prymnesium parvum]|uniref:ODAD1 central coiled coil region domain-containing protein n=1 Tax=Prymnesium parvum TaxID=97485 RepID=A0AB34ICV5_PRYPA